MFSRISPQYDRMNRLMTAGLDGRWRRAAVAAAEPRGADVLDIGCGTGDLSAEFRRAGAGSVTGADFSAAMLARARDKAGGKTDGKAGGGDWLQADALRLPFADGSFDAVASAFVLRNLVNLPAAFAEMLRVLRPGGRVVALDITHPPPGPFGAIMRFGFEQGVTRLAGILSGQGRAYRYLPGSLEGYPPADELSWIIEAAGAEPVRYRRFGGGMVALHIARMPAADGTEEQRNGQPERTGG